ncbi:hypothetical protein [Deinococcus humi]|uniref:Glycosyl-4,4'-diaponeurosporenoate acyltransferase n=1 Tax=Deinococcus humi TaxID=662880 RepID=A0A7W8NHA3_9DEIO|nr:hypothetical protein [Deinococcus humi]MBB5365655.1 hypothetical protein [Deinococcus humi]GGO36960.1 hypothetical protein GCM10008949_41610 [Deinococcus humi]
MNWGLASGLTVALALWTSQFLPLGAVPAFAFAWLLHWLLMIVAVKVVPQSLRRTAGPLTFNVGPSEFQWYRRLGVRAFDRGLDLIGWNWMIREARGYTGKRGALAGLAEETWRSELGHAWAFLTTCLIALPLWFSQSDVVTGLLVLTVPLHVYPMMLQRLLRWRIQQLQG